MVDFNRPLDIGGVNDYTTPPPDENGLVRTVLIRKPKEKPILEFKPQVEEKVPETEYPEYPNINLPKDDGKPIECPKLDLPYDKLPEDWPSLDAPKAEKKPEDVPKLESPKTDAPSAADGSAEPNAPEAKPTGPSYNAENPHPNSGKTEKGGNGRSMVVQDDGTYKYYDKDGEEITADDFKKSNPVMYDNSLMQNWEHSKEPPFTYMRGNQRVSDYNYNLVKSWGNPANYTKNADGKYVNYSTGEVITDYVYKQLTEAYKDIQN